MDGVEALRGRVYAFMTAVTESLKGKSEDDLSTDLKHNISRLSGSVATSALRKTRLTLIDVSLEIS